MRLVVGIGAIAGLVRATEVQFPIAASGTRCFGEELQAHDLMVVKAESVVDKTMKFSVVVKAALHGPDSTPSQTIHREEGRVAFSHAFTSTTPGAHWVCITNEDGWKEMNVQLSIKSGVQAKDYSQIAKKDHLEPAQLSIRMIQDTLHEYRSNLFYQRRREERMRETIDSTASRALTFCILNVLLIAGVGLCQAYFFRRFFRSKKII